MHLGQMIRRLSLVFIAVALVLAGCGGLLLRPNGPDLAEGLPPGARVTAGQLESESGCVLDYRTYRPAPDVQALHDDSAALRGGDWVILAHGFLRSQRRMQGLAAAMAADGVQVATLDFCNQKPWAGRHVQNSRDMVALARHLDARRVVYAGFSAGGLAALVAGRTDARTLGIVTLDLVDAQGLGVGAARGLRKPLLALAGEPTNCNALNNAGAVFRATDQARVRRIDGAGHCDFEAPTDGLCELVCADPAARDRPAGEHAWPDGLRRQQIIAGASAAARALLTGAADDWASAESYTQARRSQQLGAVPARKP